MPRSPAQALQRTQVGKYIGRLRGHRRPKSQVAGPQLWRSHEVDFQYHRAGGPAVRPCYSQGHHQPAHTSYNSPIPRSGRLAAAVSRAAGSRLSPRQVPCDTRPAPRRTASAPRRVRGYMCLRQPRRLRGRCVHRGAGRGWAVSSALTSRLRSTGADCFRHRDHARPPRAKPRNCCRGGRSMHVAPAPTFAHVSLTASAVLLGGAVSAAAAVIAYSLARRRGFIAVTEEDPDGQTAPGYPGPHPRHAIPCAHARVCSAPPRSAVFGQCATD